MKHLFKHENFLNAKSNYENNFQYEQGQLFM